MTKKITFTDIAAAVCMVAGIGLVTEAAADTYGTNGQPTIVVNKNGNKNGKHKRANGKRGKRGKRMLMKANANPKMVAKYDTNGDGKIGKGEAKALKRAHRAKKLARFDKDRDGKLSKTERKAMRKSRKVSRFKKIDSNGDNVLTRAELRKHKLVRQNKRTMAVKRGAAKPRHANRRGKTKNRFAARFAKMDTNSDGVISRREFVTAKRHHKYRRRGKRIRDHRSKKPITPTYTKPIYKPTRNVFWRTFKPTRSVFWRTFKTAFTARLALSV